MSPYLLGDTAVLCGEEGDPQKSARLFGATQAAFAGIDQIPDPDDAAELDRLRLHLIDTLGQEAFQVARDAGALLRLEDALHEAFGVDR